MARKTKTAKKEIIAPTVNSDAILTQTHRDITTALLIVSLTINLFVLIGWVLLQVTTAYDTQVASFLFTR